MLWGGGGLLVPHPPLLLVTDKVPPGQQFSAIAVDLDGTLLNEDHKVSEAYARVTVPLCPLLRGLMCKNGFIIGNILLVGFVGLFLFFHVHKHMSEQ